MRIFRLLKIASVASRYGLDEMVLEHEPSGRLVRLANSLQFWRDLSAPRAVRLRLALEALGPIFVKFGQVLSTRRDLLPADIADELAKLQDRVPPFDSHLALAEIEKAYGRPASEVFAEFDPEPVATASIAQVHFARAQGGTAARSRGQDPAPEHAVGHRPRPGAARHAAPMLLERLWSDGKRLKPREVVAEFDKYLHDELDLMREAANASQLRRNFADSQLLIVPEVHWDWCTPTRDGHGAHARHADLADRQAARRRHRSAEALRAPASRSSSPRCSATASSTPTCIPATSSSRRTAATSRSTSASSAR